MKVTDVDFETPAFVVHHYYITGSIALLMNILVFYLLLFQSKRMDTFKYYLLLFQVACTSVDVHISFMMQPITLFPIRSGHCAGVLPVRLQLSPHLMMTIFSFLVGFQVNSLNICFLRKHKAISRIGGRYRMPKWLYVGLMTFFIFYTFTFTTSFYFSKIPKEKQWEIIDRDYPMFREQFKTLDNFDIYEQNAAFMAFVLLIVAGCLQSTMKVSILVFQMMRSLSRCSKNLSKATLEKHKIAIKSLVAQFMTTPVAILPAMLIVSTLLVPFEGAQVFTWYMLMIMATHSTINSLVLIFTLPEFRSFLFFWKRVRGREKKVSVSIMRASGSHRMSLFPS